MSKPNDGRSRAPGATPPPSHPVAGKVGADSTKATPGARPRAAVPRERSGPIGISKGDFSTPIVRRRTTTQPRGIPVVGGTPPAEPNAAQPTPAPSRPLEPARAESLPLELPLAVPYDSEVGAAPAADDSPFSTPGAQVDAANEAAALAAEAAAVRALDPGPGTPQPELAGPATPLPVPIVTPSPASSASSALPAEEPEGTATPAPTLAVATSMPEIEDLPTPPPQPALRAAVTDPEALSFPAVDEPVTPPPSRDLSPPPELATATPPPAAAASNGTPAPDSSGARAALESRALVNELPPAAAFAEPDEDAETPKPKLVASAASVDVGAVEAELAAQALGAHATAEEVESADDSLEVVDAVDGVRTLPADEIAGDESDAPPAPKTTLRTPTPPPIPGSFLKTPGPEIVQPLVEPATPPPVGATASDATPPPVASASGEASGQASGEEGSGPLLPGLPILPEALAQRPRRPKRSKPWFEEVFDEDYLRTLPFMRADQTLREVEFISESLRLVPGAEVLDIACGYGRHAIELVQRGVSVTGLDLSLPLLIRAADEAQRRALTVNFVHADMREMSFERQFDGAYSMLTSFGYFDEETNLRVAERAARALKPGARFLLDVVNRDYVVADLPVRVWWEGTGCVVLEEVDFNFHTSRIVTRRSIVFEDGRQLEQEISVRAYSLHEIGRLLRQAGFRVIEVSGGLATRGNFFGTASRNLFIVAEKREEDAT